MQIVENCNLDPLFSYQTEISHQFSICQSLIVLPACLSKLSKFTPRSNPNRTLSLIISVT